MHLDIARKYIGTSEKAGKEHNAAIVKMYADVGFPGVKDDETAWCAAFVGSTLKAAGLPYLKSLTARSYLNYGKKLTEPKEGCIVVFWRGKPDGWQGHVGFVTKFDDKHVWCLGGNQNNQVNETRYPKTKVLGYRMPNVAAQKEVLKTAEKNVEKVIVQKSKKLSLIKNVRHFLSWIVATVSGVFSLGTLDVANQAVAGFKGFMSDHWAIMALLGAGGFWLLLKWLERESVKDYKEGRYTPSKMEKQDA